MRASRDRRRGRSRRARRRASAASRPRPRPLHRRWRRSPRGRDSRPAAIAGAEVCRARMAIGDREPPPRGRAPGPVRRAGRSRRPARLRPPGALRKSAGSRGDFGRRTITPSRSSLERAKRTSAGARRGAAAAISAVVSRRPSMRPHNSTTIRAADFHCRCSAMKNTPTPSMHSIATSGETSKQSSLESASILPFAIDAEGYYTVSRRAAKGSDVALAFNAQQ